MDALRDLTGLSVPTGLAELRDAPERHRDVIGRDEICAYVLSMKKGGGTL